MARALVVFEATDDGTRRVAQAVARGLGVRLDARAVPVERAPERLDGVDLVVAGGPSFAHETWGDRARQEGVARGAHSLDPGSRRLGIWLDRVEAGTAAFATWDTRLHGPRWLWGSSARIAASRLLGRGLRILAAPISFRVPEPVPWVGVPVLGEPPDAGELDEARAWGEGLAEALLGAAAAVAK
jgi:hypothetical protein